jgi:hypothetical protein
LCCRGGLFISQPKEITKNANGFVCPNALCRKIFTRPVETTNVQVSTEPYKTCPFCLTKISGAPEIIFTASVEEEVDRSDSVIEQPKQSEAVPNPTGCKKHFGFLSERASNVPIPDECLTCTDVLQCMRKKSKD